MTIQTLLTSVGFANIRFHMVLAPDSSRNQDLGMMAHRMFLTAEAPRKAARQRHEVPFPEVTVLLGDPRLPDPVKRNGQFNSEDFDTIERFKSALAEIRKRHLQRKDESPAAGGSVVTSRGAKRQYSAASRSPHRNEDADTVRRGKAKASTKSG